MTKLNRFALSTSAAVALLAGASTMVSAAPLGAKFESLKSAAPAASETVQWRRSRGRDVAIGIGAFGTGLVIGSAIANRGYYDAPYGYYDAPYGYYDAPYGYYGNSNGSQFDGYDLEDRAGK